MIRKRWLTVKLERRVIVTCVRRLYGGDCGPDKVRVLQCRLSKNRVLLMFACALGWSRLASNYFWPRAFFDLPSDRWLRPLVHLLLLLLLLLVRQLDFLRRLGRRNWLLRAPCSPIYHRDESRVSLAHSLSPAPICIIRAATICHVTDI